MINDMRIENCSVSPTLVVPKSAPKSNEALNAKTTQVAIKALAEATKLSNSKGVFSWWCSVLSFLFDSKAVDVVKEGDDSAPPLELGTEDHLDAQIAPPLVSASPHSAVVAHARPTPTIAIPAKEVNTNPQSAPASPLTPSSQGSPVSQSSSDLSSPPLSPVSLASAKASPKAIESEQDIMSPPQKLKTEHEILEFTAKLAEKAYNHILANQAALSSKAPMQSPKSQGLLAANKHRESSLALQKDHSHAIKSQPKIPVRVTVSDPNYKGRYGGRPVPSRKLKP
jgi:hypothetical protein